MPFGSTHSRSADTPARQPFVAQARRGGRDRRRGGADEPRRAGLRPRPGRAGQQADHLVQRILDPGDGRHAGRPARRGDDHRRQRRHQQLDAPLADGVREAGHAPQPAGRQVQALHARGERVVGELSPRSLRQDRAVKSRLGGELQDGPLGAAAVEIGKDEGDARRQTISRGSPRCSRCQNGGGWRFAAWSSGPGTAGSAPAARTPRCRPSVPRRSVSLRWAR